MDMLSHPRSYHKRAESHTHPLAKKLLKLMADKQTNLALSADVTEQAKLLELADQLGPEICVLKTHIDIIEDFDGDLPGKLRKLADKHHFLIFEDRKFADIGNTVKLQYQKGIYHIAEWADMVNAHVLPGPGIIEGLKEVGQPKGRALLLLAEMSSSGHLFTPDYQIQVLDMAEKNPDFVIGFISQHSLAKNQNWLYFTPGVKLNGGKDSLGQQYRTPREAIINQGCDVIIIGRDIIHAKDPLSEAKRYREHGWKAYLELFVDSI